MTGLATAPHGRGGLPAAGVTRAFQMYLSVAAGLHRGAARDDCAARGSPSHDQGQMGKAR